VAEVVAAVVCGLWTLLSAELNPHDPESRPQAENEAAG